MVTVETGTTRLLTRTAPFRSVVHGRPEPPVRSCTEIASMHQSPPRRPRRIVARTLGFGIGALVAAALLTWSPAVVSGWSQSSAESTLWQLLNGARANNGRAPLQQHATLVSLARWRSSDMLAKSYFSHTIIGCGCLVYAYYDSNGLNYDWAGENIGWNAGHPDSYSPVRAHEQFMGSPGHRANVLDPSFTHGGVGAAMADNKPFLGNTQNTRMYTELFMESTSGAPAPPAPAPAPPPPPGGGSGGGGGGGSAPAPAQPAATPEPSAQRATVDAPRRPTSTAGIDGVSTLVVAAEDSVAVIQRWRDAEMATAPVEPRDERAATAAAEAGGIEVAAAPQAPSLFEGVIGSILGFLFG